jgi:hypothetical protein
VIENVGVGATGILQAAAAASVSYFHQSILTTSQATIKQNVHALWAIVSEDSPDMEPDSFEQRTFDQHESMNRSQRGQ